MKSSENSWSLRQVVGQGGLPKLMVETPWSEAEIYLHGAHVTHFQKKGEKPLLFMSESSQFAAGKAIRGGVPLIFPWFGGREGSPAHGVGRIHPWELVRARPLADGGVALRFLFPKELQTTGYPQFEAEFEVEIGAELGMRLMLRNASKESLTIEDCLHTYFQVGDIRQVTVSGLKGVEFFDKVDAGKIKREDRALITIESEVDRVYYNTRATTEIRDESFQRVICIKKEGAASTVVWNPWAQKSKSMSDFGDEDYWRMICVESGNVAGNIRTLAPGDRASTGVRIATAGL